MHEKSAILTFPKVPQENNILAHKVTQWVEDAENELMAKQMLEVSRGGMPRAARRIIDTPISTVPPEGGVLSRREDQTVKQIQAENLRNAMRREELWLGAWTSLYTAIVEATKETAPLLCESIRASCNMGKIKSEWAEFGDGPLAFRMVLHCFRGRPRTKNDKKFYQVALDLQEKQHLPDGTTGAEYSRRARAFYKYINPNLTRPHEGGDITEYLIDLMPNGLKESKRRLKDKLRAEGTYLNYEIVIEKCTELVVEEQKQSAPAPTFMVTPGVLTDIAMVASGETSRLIFEVCGSNVSFTDTIAPVPGLGASDPFAGLGKQAGGGKKWCDGCPHKTRAGKPVECAASPHYEGPPPVSLYVRKDVWAAIMKLRAKNCAAEGIVEKPVKLPTQEKIDSFKQWRAKQAERVKGKEKEKSSPPAAAALPLMPDGWAEVAPICVGVSEELLGFPGIVEELDSDTDEAEAEEMAHAMASPIEWYVMYPRYGTTGTAYAACSTRGTLPEHDSTSFECRRYEDEASARLAAAMGAAKDMTQELARKGEVPDPGPGEPTAVPPRPALVGAGASRPTKMSQAEAASLDLRATKIPPSQWLGDDAGGRETAKSTEPKGANSETPRQETPAAPTRPPDVTAPKPDERTRSALVTPVPRAGGVSLVGDGPHSLVKSLIPQGGGGKSTRECALGAPPGTPLGATVPPTADVVRLTTPIYEPYVHQECPPPAPTPAVQAHREPYTPFTTMEKVDAPSDEPNDDGGTDAGRAADGICTPDNTTIGIVGLVAAASARVGGSSAMTAAFTGLTLILVGMLKAHEKRFRGRVADVSPLVERRYTTIIGFIVIAMTIVVTCGAAGTIPFALGAYVATPESGHAQVEVATGRIVAMLEGTLRVVRENMLAIIIIILLCVCVTGANGEDSRRPISVGMTCAHDQRPYLTIPQVRPNGDDDTRRARQHHLGPHHSTSPSLSEMPRADLLTEAQCLSLFEELLGGQEYHVAGLSEAYTRTLAIVDSGCAKSMGNHPDQYREGSIKQIQSSVIGVSGKLTLERGGELQWPMMTEQHGIRKWIELDSPMNEKCSFVLLGIGRHLTEKGASLSFPGGGGDGKLIYPSGVSVKIMNRDVFVLRPIGYQEQPDKAMVAISPADLGVPDKGHFVLVIASGSDREGGIKWWCEKHGAPFEVVLIDPIVGGPVMDITRKPTATALTIAASARRCVGVFWCIRCKTWSAVKWLPKADGSPGTPDRDVDNVTGIKREDGTLSPAVVESNLEVEHTAMICTATASHGGFVIGEQPARRRAGHCVAKHALLGCERATHMFDHPAWRTFAEVFGAEEGTFEQCMAADESDSEKTHAKGTALLFTPNARRHVKHHITEPLQCNHPPHGPGSHKALRGVNEKGEYLTSSTRSEVYSSKLCERLAMTIIDIAESLGVERVTSSVLGMASMVIRGKHLAKEHITHELIHSSWCHRERRALRHLSKALCDADGSWDNAVRDAACDVCLRANSNRLGPTGELPRHPTLIYLDTFHMSIKDVFFGIHLILGATHSTSGVRKSVGMKLKSQAEEALQMILAFYASLGVEVRWVHSDGAPDIVGGKCLSYMRSRSIRVTINTKNSSRHNLEETGWRSGGRMMRANLTQAKVPNGMWFPMWADGEECANLIPSRDAPHDCAIGRAMSTATKTVKPKGSHRRPPGCLCYVTIAERWPSGTLKNKVAEQGKRAIHLTYVGGPTSSWEAVGFQHAQPGYCCFVPELNKLVITSDVYFPLPFVFPGLKRTSGGGWCIPEEAVAGSDARMRAEVGQQQSQPLTYIEVGDKTMEELESVELPIELRHGWEATSGGNENETDTNGVGTTDKTDTGGADETDKNGAEDMTLPPAPKPREKRWLVPRKYWPDYECNEHGGAGWEVKILYERGPWARCKYLYAKDKNGMPFENAWRAKKELEEIDDETPDDDEMGDETREKDDDEDDVLNSEKGAPTPPPPNPTTTMELQEELVPNANTIPADGHTDPMKDTVRPTRERREPDRLTADRFGFTSIAGLAAHYAECSGLGFRTRRLPLHAFVVNSSSCLERLLHHLAPPSAMMAATNMTAGEGWRDEPERYVVGEGTRAEVQVRVGGAGREAEKWEEKVRESYVEEITAAYNSLPQQAVDALSIALDHSEIVAEYGERSPQAIMVRETYAAAMASAACDGLRLPNLDVAFNVFNPGDPLHGGMTAHHGIFDDKYDGMIFACDQPLGDPDLMMLAKAKTAPHIYTERQMRGPEWDTPKQMEMAKFEKLGAKTDVALDDPRIRGMPIIDTMWAGADKFNDQGECIKKNARCVIRGDLQKKFYNVTPNDTFAPVSRNSSFACCEAVGRLRKQSYDSGDVPGAYLQGNQTESEQQVARPPPGFRKYDERGVEIVWLMIHPMYGQADAGAIWNRTYNECMVTDAPAGCGYGRSSNDPAIYSKVVGESAVCTLGCYVDDWRSYYDRAEASVKEWGRIKGLLKERFGIDFKGADPETDFFLGSNRISKHPDVATLKASTYIELMAKRYLGDKWIEEADDTKKYPGAWGHTPSDQHMMKDWEHACATRPYGDKELAKRYGSLFGSLMHAVKFRPEISATIGLCGTCLTFPTEAMYQWLVRILIYLVRTRNMGITFSNRGEKAAVLRCYADSNWSETRSTTGYVMLLAGGAVAHASKRQHCITMSSCEAELVALCDAAIELLYVKDLVEFLGHSVDGAIEVFTDNKGAYDLCHRYTSAQHSRHVDRKLFKMRELRGAKVVTVAHVPTESNPADLFTKILPRPAFEKHRATVMNTAAEIHGEAHESREKDGKT